MDKLIIIKNIEFKRIIMHIKGEFLGFSNTDHLKAVFISADRKKYILPQHCEKDGDSFYLVLNTLSANKEHPINSGDYLLKFFDMRGDSNLSITDYIEKKILQKAPISNNEFSTFLCEEIKNKLNKDSDNKMNLVINKSANNFFRTFSALDLDSEEFLIKVNYRQPKPSKTFWEKRKMNLKKRLYAIAKKGFISLFYFFSKHVKRKGNTIFFTSGSRGEIGGNEKFIYDRMNERDLLKNYKIRFHFKESILLKQNIFKRLQFVYYLSTSDIIIVDDYYPILYQVDYPKDVKVVQVWHACGAFKAVGMERIVKPGGPPINTRVHKCYTHIPVSSEHSALHGAESFCIDLNKFYPIGVPRTDLFFDKIYSKEIKEKLYQEFPETKEADRVILYAPTFRGNGAQSAYFPFYKIDLKAWGERLKRTNTILIIKMHPFVKEKIRIPSNYKKWIIDAASYREVNDILFIVDLLITDYSSIIYEFSLLNRPMLFYAFDLNMYEASRDFYEPYEDIVPGKIVKTFDDLMLAIEEKDYNFEKMNNFVTKNFSYTDGKSTDRLIDQIILSDN